MRGRRENEREAIERETTQGQHPRDSRDRERERGKRDNLGESRRLSFEIRVEATSRPVQCMHMHVTGPRSSINQFTGTGSTATCKSPVLATSVNHSSLVIA